MFRGLERVTVHVPVACLVLGLPAGSPTLSVEECQYLAIAIVVYVALLMSYHKNLVKL